MKKIIGIILSGITITYAQFEVDINTAIEDIKKGSETMVEGVNKATDGMEKKEGTNEQNKGTSDQNSAGKVSSSDTEKISLRSYQNYDFVAGEKIIFEDHFLGDMDAEFPAHWDLTGRQAVVNKQAGKTCFLITDGNYGRVNPVIKNKTYLTSEFTMEFDYYQMTSAYGVQIGFFDIENNEGTLNISGEGIGGTFGDKYLFGAHPSEIQYSGFMGKWHHIAIAYKNNQLKVYVNQTRVLVMPNIAFQPVSLDFHGIGNTESPIIFTNVKIAEGGKMNMLDKIMTDGKIITHGILFDVNKASIKPESMGVINQIFQLLKDNADLKFEIGGYTDGDGDESSNLKLSEQRAIAVKEQLISMGIQASRLTTKGYGESNPIDNNLSLEGKANNRRVEFTKQ